LVVMIQEADAWLISNPKKQKKNYKQFLNNWFKNNEQWKDEDPKYTAEERKAAKIESDKEQAYIKKLLTMTDEEVREILKKEFPEQDGD